MLGDWRGDEASFLKWRGDMLATINRVLWPRVDQERRKWVGPAVDVMGPLTEVDLGLIRRIRQPVFPRLLDRVPTSPLRTPDCPAHAEFYKREDGQVEGSKSAKNIQLYNKNFDAAKAEKIAEWMGHGMSKKLGLGLIFWFKSQLARPRPYQTSLHMGIPITHEEARTALHPSMISGHCVQGLAGLIGVAERAQLDAVPLTAEDWEALSQFCVDFGDRRVMAGVHYPSDNISSWLLALELCEHAVDPVVRLSVKERVWHAISDRSLIYKEIQAAVTADSASPYKPSWAELQMHAP